MPVAAIAAVLLVGILPFCISGTSLTVAVHSYSGAKADVMAHVGKFVFNLTSIVCGVFTRRILVRYR